MRAARGPEAYARFLDAAAREYEYDATRGTDEKLLTLFLLTPPDLARVARAHAAPYTHPLHGRSKDPPRWPAESPAPPRYGPARPAARVFAYDAEVPRRLTLRPLAWEAPPRPRRSGRDPVHAGARGKK